MEGYLDDSDSTSITLHNKDEFGIYANCYFGDNLGPLLKGTYILCHVQNLPDSGMGNNNSQ
jgi:hypothetical protein